MKIETHFYQMSAVKRFQEYAPDWPEKKETTLYDYEGSIKSVPITLITGELDDVCPASYADRYLAAKLPTLERHIEIAGWGHNEFHYANQPEFFEILHDAVSRNRYTPAGAGTVAKEIATFAVMAETTEDGGFDTDDNEMNFTSIMDSIFGDGAMTLAPTATTFIAAIMTSQLLILQ